MTFSEADAQRVIGMTMYGSDGDKIGAVGQVFLDDVSGRPEWVTVRTGLFGTNESFVPLEGATFAEDGLRVPYGKGTVKDAPNVAVDAGHLSEEEEQRLFAHYERDYAAGYPTGTDADRQRATGPLDREAAADSGRPVTGDAMTRSEETTARRYPGPELSEAEHEVVLHEEQVVVEKKAVPVERVRLDTETVTEEQQVTEDFRKEHIETEGVDEADPR